MENKILLIIIIVNFYLIHPPMHIFASASDEPKTYNFDAHICLDFENENISNALKALSNIMGVNIVVGKDITGEITISLDDVDLFEALDAILLPNGYSYRVKGDIIFVEKKEDKFVTEVLFLSYARAIDTKPLLEKILSEKGDIRVDERSNVLVITDCEENINKARELIYKTDVPAPQVLIDAKLIDITTTDLENLGVTWTVNTIFSDDLPSAVTAVSGTSSEKESATGTYTLRGPSSSLTGSQFTFGLTLSEKTLSATLDALIKNQKAKLLANPKIMTLNNQEAKIVIGEKVPYKETTTTLTGTIENTQFIDVGTTLRVTPQINKEGYIVMSIHPEVSSVTSFVDNQPRLATREARTNVMVKDGQVVVIAGLVKKDKTLVKSKVPILGYIPILGFLFQNKSLSDVQTELVIFITPHIIQQGKVSVSNREEELYNLLKEEKDNAVERTLRLMEEDKISKY